MNKKINVDSLGISYHFVFLCLFPSYKFSKGGAVWPAPALVSYLPLSASQNAL